jgi:HK97 gp10 family phage protein
VSVSVEVIELGATPIERGLDEFDPTLEVESRRGIEESTALVEATAKALAPKRTHHLEQSIASKVEGRGLSLTGRVYTDAPYAAYVEEGTRAHEIVAHGQALAIPVGAWSGAGSQGQTPRSGDVNFFRRVHHPGSKAEPFMQPALDKNKGRIEGLMKAAEDRVVEIASHGG